MPRFFFDIHDDKKITHDEVGVELPDMPVVRETAMKALPKIAADEIPQDGDRQHFAVLVTDEDGRPVYSATLNYTGLWLLR